MNVLIMIMGCNCEPGARNIEAILNTYIKSYYNNKNLFKHNYDFIVYKGGFSEVKLNNNILHLTSPDDIKSTFMKTLEAFRFVENYNFDYIVRINISTYLNLFMLDNSIELFDKNNIYCNAICVYTDSLKYKNFIFPRGDAYIMHKDLFLNILNNQYDPYSDDLYGIDNTDDSMFGLLCNNYFKNDLHNHIKLLRYAFIPYEYDKIDNYYIKLSACVIFSRIKTCPPNTHSGYSWEDNIYRLHDVKKFNILNIYNYNVKNTNIDIIFDDNDDREFYIRNNDNGYDPVTFNNIKKMLDERR